MQDGIIQGTGNSRYLKTVSDALTRYPTYESFIAALVAGTLPVDFNGINESGWQQIGTALNKGNLAADGTLALFGLNESNVPNDVLAFLGKHNQHWWRITDTVQNIWYELVTTSLPGDTSVTGTDTMAEAPVEVPQTIQYASSISFDETTGEITLVDAQELTVSMENASELAALAPVYVTNLVASGVYYIPEGATVGGLDETATINYGVYTWLESSATIPAQYVYSLRKIETVEEASYVQSSDRNAYPDAGVDGTKAYCYLGVPFEKTSKEELITVNALGSMCDSLTFGLSGSSLVTKSATGTIGYLAESVGLTTETAEITFSFENLPDNARICYMGDFSVTGTSSGTANTSYYGIDIATKINDLVVDLGVAQASTSSFHSYDVDCNFIDVIGRPLRNTDTITITIKTTKKTSYNYSAYVTCSSVSSCSFKYINV